MTNPETVIAEALRCSSPFGPGGEAGSHPDWLRDWLDEVPEHLLAALKDDARIAVVKLPASPSEYWGPEHQPQWNHYPFTRVDRGEVEVGARCEHVYRIGVAEARIFAADLLAAADAAEAQR
ncbi:hypothetical protein [Mycolicibacterium fortuitum]|uniref:hypothetical protein n=1 Tax=Mycolicibacterium fortuitum TaxID=1766 RepID=UPI002607BC3B|nr:hypothetical protein [Mycolicibacterium fortuitum]